MTTTATLPALPDWAPADARWSTPYIGRCPVKGCKHARATRVVEVLVPVRRMGGDGQYHVAYHARRASKGPGHHLGPNDFPSWVAQELTDHGIDSIRCPEHGRPLRWEKVQGSHSDVRQCDVRCTSAKGHKCECSCSGMNHGADYC